MTRGPYRRAISIVLSWNTITNAQTTPKINLPPINDKSSAPLAEMLDYANSRDPWPARDKFLFARASPTSGSDDNDSASATPSSLSSLSSTPLTPSSTTPSSATPSSSADSGIDIPTVHSPVPMVAGSLAGFIAILAAVLVIIVVRRRKNQPMSRTNVRPPLPPFMGGTMPRDVEQDVYPTESSHPRGRTRSAHPKSPTKRGSRYEYTTEDVELGLRDSDSPGRGDPTKLRHSSNFTGEGGYNRRHSSGRARPSRLRVGAHASASVNRYELDVLDATPPSHTHGQISPSAPHTTSVSPFSPNDPRPMVTDDNSFLLPSNSRSNIDGMNADVPSAFSTPPIIRREKDWEDLPPAYEDVR